MMFEPTIKLEHQDSRGEIYSIQLPYNRELMLIHSTPGAKRGGHSHTCDEVVMVISGKMRYHKIGSIREYGPGLSSFNKAGVIHMGEFQEDTWLIEYKLASEWSQSDHEPWRKQVRESQQ